MPIDDDWDELCTPSVAPKPNASMDVNDDWCALRALPKTFYFIDKGFSLQSMAIHVLTCVGERDRPVRMGGPAFLGIKLDLIWSGARYKTRSEEIGKVYAYPKSKCDLTRDAAAIRFNQYLEAYQKSIRDSLTVAEDAFAKHLRELRRLRAEAKELEVFSITKELEELDALKTLNHAQDDPV